MKNFYFSKWAITAKSLNDIPNVKVRTLSTLFEKLRILSGGSISLSFLKGTVVIAKDLRAVARSQGIKGLTLYLKTSSVLLQQSVAGHRIVNVSEVGPRVSRTGSGLPRLIPARHRQIIVNRYPGCYILIKYYLSIFYIYRVLEFPGKLKLETITNPGKFFNMPLYEGYMENFLKLFLRKSRKTTLELKTREVFPIFRSSPFTTVLFNQPIKVGKKFRLWSTHASALVEAARVMMVSDLFPILWEFMSALKMNALKSFLRYQVGFKLQMKDGPEMGKEIREAFMNQHLGVETDGFSIHPALLASMKTFKANPFYGKPSGKLGLKDEPAGKVRVFAMVDPITQWVLNPLHKAIFSILRDIPMDGTFNQLRPVYRLFRLSGVRKFFSLDLSAATDRLPVALQARLLDRAVKDIPFFGQKWAALLIARDYRISSVKYGVSGKLRYSVGQPMGALSSWAMLALTHHFIIQVAAWEVGYDNNRLFTKYAVLGDDVVIADWKVAKSYLRILDDLGVSCGLHKSVLSHKGTGLEFAKRTFVDRQDCSPISIDELQVSLSDLTSWSAFVSKLKLSWDRQARVLGFGAYSRQKCFNKLNHALQLVYLSQIAKVDFNTEVLKLRKGAPKDFDSIYLEIFRQKAIKPLFARLHRSIASFPMWVKQQHSLMTREYLLHGKEYNRFDIRNAFDLVLGNHEILRTKLSSIIDSRVELSPEDLSAFMYFGFDDRVFDWLWGKLSSKIETFDEALKFYFEMRREITKVSLDNYSLTTERARNPSKRLPVQAELFREWSRLSHHAVAEYRKSMQNNQSSSEE